MSISETERRFGAGQGDPAPNEGARQPAGWLAPAEAEALIAQCSRRAPSGIRNRAMITLLYRSGLRVSEMLGDKDPRRKIPPLRPSALNFSDRSIRLLGTKSGHPQTRYWHAWADDALLRWLEERRRMGVARNGTPLFCTITENAAHGFHPGAPVSRQYLTQLLKRLAAGAGIDKRVHPHGLRHTFAVELLREGTDIVTISKLLGHSSIAVTAKYLDHLTNDEAGKRLQQVSLPGGPDGAALPGDLEDEVAALQEQVANLATRLGGRTGAGRGGNWETWSRSL